MIGTECALPSEPLHEAFTALNLQGKEKPADVDGGFGGLMDGCNETCIIDESKAWSSLQQYSTSCIPSRRERVNHCSETIP